MNAFEYLQIASSRGSKLGLERISELCKLLGEPQNKIPIVHIAGTNGKGSFGAMLSAILTDCGYNTGSFSSPALTDVTDSFRINGKELPYDEFDRLICGLIPVCESLSDKPTEFEVLTVAAYELFTRKKCDIALVECGLGGDTDSTNVVESPILSVITNAAIDHTAFLGNTIKEIARRKAGIIKPKRPVLFGGNNSEAYEIISEISAKNGSELTVTDHSSLSVVSHDIRCTILHHDRFGKLTSYMSGTYQAYNIANVLAAVDILRRNGLNIPESSVKSGISSARWHGRFELVSDNPTIIFDGAHNPDGIVQASESIKTYFSGKVVLLIGVMADKEYTLYPELLGKFTEKAFTVTPDNPRALDSEILARTFSEYGIKSSPCGSVADGVEQAVEYVKKRNVPLIALGSLYMYREFKDALDNILKQHRTKLA